MCVLQSPFLLCLSRSEWEKICQKFPCVMSTQLHWCCCPTARRDTKGKLRFYLSANAAWLFLLLYCQASTKTPARGGSAGLQACPRCLLRRGAEERELRRFFPPAPEQSVLPLLPRTLPGEPLPGGMCAATSFPSWTSQLLAPLWFSLPLARLPGSQGPGKDIRAWSLLPHCLLLKGLACFLRHTSPSNTNHHKHQNLLSWLYA